MNSKAFILLSLLFAVVLLISSTVADETSKAEIKPEETNEADTRCKHGCCGGYSKYGGCGKCCRDANEAQAFAAQTNSMPEKEDEVKETDHYKGHCSYGCCGPWGDYGCLKCCHYKGHCSHGCCGPWGHYGCMKCCKNAAEAADHETNQQIEDANTDGGYGGGYGGGGSYGGGGYGGGGGRGGYGGGWGGGRGGGGGGWGGGRGGGGYGGGRGRGGGGRGRGGGRHCPGCSNAEEAGNMEKEAKP